MCITFLYVNPGDSSIKYKLILINNRDEDYARETKKATLTRTPDVNGELQTIYGVDLAGAVKGTWLGISARNGMIRLGNLANVTGEHRYGKLGRGPIVTDFIKSTESIELHNQKLFDQSQDFGNFNFLSVAINRDDINVHYVSNTPKTAQKLSPGFIGLGNSPMCHPFKKVEEGTEIFKKIVEKHSADCKDDFIEHLLTMLKCDQRYLPDDELQMRRQESAPFFSSIHVRITEVHYGSRTRTIILVDNNDNIDYLEETMTTMDPDGPWERTHITLPIART